MKKILLSAMVVGAMSFAVNGFAADTSMSSSTTGTTMQQEAMKTWQSMSPTEKKEVREKLKAAWKKLTPEQKEQIRKKAQKKWESLTPDQKQKLIDEFMATQATTH